MFIDEPLYKKNSLHGSDMSVQDHIALLWSAALEDERWL
jgi:hypothetical protein